MSAKEVTVYLSLGSNMGDRQQNLKMALDFLSQRLRLGKVSEIYETEPVDNVNQPKFLNLVCEAFTRLPPASLLAIAKGIENKLGRVGKSGEPRPIDIDIILYDEEVVDTPELKIPHPKMIERAFVLVPLAEIAPDQIHPPSGKTIKELLASVGEKQGVLKLE